MPPTFLGRSRRLRPSLSPVAMRNIMPYPVSSRHLWVFRPLRTANSIRSSYMHQITDTHLPDAKLNFKYDLKQTASVLSSRHYKKQRNTSIVNKLNTISGRTDGIHTLATHPHVPVTLDTLFSVRNVTNAVISPDGKHVAFVVWAWVP